MHGEGAQGAAMSVAAVGSSNWYANEENCQWKKIIVAIYESRESNLLPHNLSHYNKSWVWRSIVHPLTTNDSIRKSFVDNPKILAGNDEKINFWAGCWVREFLLKSIFSRVFALAVKKVGNIVDFGFWLDEKLVWHVEHKRPPFH
uniref:Reverse transcriptase zinc-binding domain-containing protein n=1 Tax=Gossypium raimondii TaxID=29730 RepID=A0A0D2UVM2_GOSRA|nr:hypothetical protein B456_011G201200 [Gossypium raimondii]